MGLLLLFRPLAVGGPTYLDVIYTGQLARGRNGRSRRAERGFIAVGTEGVIEE